MRGDDKDAYTLDSLTPPFKNPYKSWMRFGGIDFFSDGRAAVSTWSGDVWIVSGIDDGLQNLKWKRYAAGLFHALGLKIVNNQVYVFQAAIQIPHGCTTSTATVRPTSMNASTTTP